MLDCLSRVLCVLDKDQDQDQDQVRIRIRTRTASVLRSPEPAPLRIKIRNALLMRCTVLRQGNLGTFYITNVRSFRPCLF